MKIWVVSMRKSAIKESSYLSHLPLLISLSHHFAGATIREHGREVA